MAVVLQKVDSAAAAHAPPQRPPPMHASGPRQQQQQSRLPQRERRSPTREERYAASDQPAAAGVSIPSDHGQAMQQQRQQDNSWRGPSFKRVRWSIQHFGGLPDWMNVVQASLLWQCESFG